MNNPVSKTTPGRFSHKPAFARTFALLLLPWLILAPSYAQVLVDEDFSSGTPGGMPTGWQSSPAGAWVLSDPLGSLVHEATGGGGALAVTEPNAPWTDYVTTIAFEFNDRPYGGIVARYVDANNFYHFRLRDDRRAILITRWLGGSATNLVAESWSASDALTPDTTYYMRFSTIGSELRGQLSEDASFSTILHEAVATDENFAQGGVGLRNFASGSVETYFKVDSFVTVVPEPAYAGLLLASSILILIGLTRRRRLAATKCARPPFR